MTSRRFQRRIENFTCEHCGRGVTGDGYTDHCPSCLWSKHVDVHPGDRASACHGMMEPSAVEGAEGSYAIRYRCTCCGYTHRVKAHAQDRTESLVALAYAHAQRQ